MIDRIIIWFYALLGHFDCAMGKHVKPRNARRVYTCKRCGEVVRSEN